jgi:hypothetical protein
VPERGFEPRTRGFSGSESTLQQPETASEVRRRCATCPLFAPAQFDAAAVRNLIETIRNAAEIAETLPADGANALRALLLNQIIRAARSLEDLQQ